MEVRKEDQRDPDEKVVEIEIERLRDFKNHPFKVQADSQMKELQESIKEIWDSQSSDCETEAGRIL